MALVLDIGESDNGSGKTAAYTELQTEVRAHAVVLVFVLQKVKGESTDAWDKLVSGNLGQRLLQDVVGDGLCMVGIYLVHHHPEGARTQWG